MSDPVATSRAFGRGVMAVREARGISLLALSEECGLAASTLSHIEYEKGGVTLTTAIIISQKLGVSVDKLIEIGEKTPPKKSRRKKAARQVELPRRRAKSILQNYYNK